MSFELFEQGPSVYIPILLISALITAAAYSVFPMSFANIRRRGISTKKYRVLCYVFNFLVMMFFVALNGSSSGAPYILWTSVFISFGLKKLERRCILVDSKSPELPTTLECHKVEKTPAQHQPTKDEQQPIRINLSQEGEAPKKYGNYAIPANELMLEVRTVEETQCPVQNVPITQDDNEKHTITRSQLKDTAVLMGLSYTDTLIRINYERQLQRKPPLTLVEDKPVAPSEPSNAPPKQEPKKKSPFTISLKQMMAILVAVVIFLVILLGLSKPNNTVISEPQETLAELSLPQNGHFFRELSLSDWLDSDGEMSEITVTASSSENVVVALKDIEGNERISFFVRAGKTATVYVPPETLYAYFASGDSWYGYEKGKMFGQYTSYSMDDEAIDFSRYTMEYTLYPVTNGNFSETPISADEFF